MQAVNASWNVRKDKKLLNIPFIPLNYPLHYSHLVFNRNLKESK